MFAGPSLAHLMDLRQLTYLVAVADTGGLRPAARRLGVAQPSVSKALDALERELGVTVLERDRRGIQLTAAGAELVSRGRDLLAGVAGAREAVRRIAAQGDGELRVGLMAGVVSAGELLEPIFAAMREAHPTLSLLLDEVSFADQVAPLLDATVDAMIVRGPITRGPLAHRELTVVPIAEEPRVLLVPATHELAGEVRVRVEDVLALPTLPMASPDEWSGFWQLDDLRGGSLCDRRVSAVGTMSEAQIAVAMCGVVSSTPATAARLQPNPLVRTVALEGAPLSVIAVARRRRDARPLVREFVSIAQRAAEQHLALLPAAVLPR